MALAYYRKPQVLNPPPDDDPSLAYTPPPIIQGYDTDPGFTVPQDPNAPPVDPGFSPPPSEPDGTQGLSETIPRFEPTPTTDGIDPSVAANRRIAAAEGKVSPSDLLANAVRKRALDKQPPDVAPMQEPQPELSNIVPVRPEDIDTGGTGDTRARRVEIDRHGRPAQDTRIKDPLERYLKYQQDLKDWEPPKAHGWKRYVVPMLQGWAAGQRSGDSPWSGLGGAITGAVTGAAKPKLTNEQWKAQQLRENQAQIDQHLEQQKIVAGIAHTAAVTKKLGEPVARPKRIVKDKNGIYRPIDPETGKDENGNLVEGESQKSVGGFKGWVHDADGVAHFWENGQDSGRLDPGRNKVKLADGRLVDPSQSYSAELTAGREGAGDERANEANRQENARTQANIKSAQYEQTKVESALKSTAPMVTRTRYDPSTARNVEYEERNPIYTDLENRRDRLIDTIRTLNGQIKPIVTPRTSSASPGFKAPTGVYTEQQVIDRWKATPPAKRVHKTADEAVEAARLGGLIPKK